MQLQIQDLAIQRSQKTICMPLLQELPSITCKLHIQCLRLVNLQNYYMYIEMTFMDNIK